MARRCLRNVPRDRVPPIMAVSGVTWRCHRPAGHRGPCEINARRAQPPHPLRPVKVPAEGSV